MHTRRFGKTELHTTVLSFGAMRIPPAADEPPGPARTRALGTIRKALDVGINHIETARGYGPSEELIGDAIREGLVRRDEFILTTKIPPMASDAEFREALDDSMLKLNVEHVDILDIHGINTMELLAESLKPNGTLAGIRRAMAEGIVGHLGFATHGPLDVILAAIQTDEFETVNLHYYYVNQRNRPAVELAAVKDMGVYIISPSDKGGRLFDPPQRLTDLCRPFTPIEMNQRWLLSQPEVHTLSVGAGSPSEFDAHLAGAGRDGALSSEESEAVGRLTGAMSVLGDTYCSFCHECLPCPEDVHIPEILRLRNLAVALDMAEFARYRYGMFVHEDAETGRRGGGAGHWFPGQQGDACTECGECLPRCPLHLPIPALLRETHGILVGKAGRRLWK